MSLGPSRPWARLGAPQWGWFLLALVLVALDLGSKSAVMGFLERWDPDLNHEVALGPGNPLVRDGRGHERYPVLGQWLGWRHSLNAGAAFGRFAGSQELLVAVRVLAGLLLVALLARCRPGTRLLPAALTLILAGALGNLWDNLFARPLRPDPERTFYPVRDFVDVYFETWDVHFPTFNLADACITLGVGLLLVASFRKEAAEREPA
ncbi:MAG: signal peptidase II [bacterium]|nr:signal peptidase II [bacterium]